MKTRNRLLLFAGVGIFFLLSIYLFGDCNTDDFFSDICRESFLFGYYGRFAFFFLMGIVTAILLGYVIFGGER